MHELSIIQNIYNTIKDIAAENNLKVIKKVYLKIGALRQVVPEFLTFAFEHVTADSLAQGAELIIEVIPVQILCHTCQQQHTVTDNFYVCPNCNSADIEIITGKEIVLASIEGEQ